MSACEICWTEASRKALMLGGFTADYYRKELDTHPEHTDARIDEFRDTHPSPVVETVDDPELEDVRGWYIDGRRVHNPFASDAALVERFDRWLASRDAAKDAELAEARRTIENLRTISNANGDWSMKYALAIQERDSARVQRDALTTKVAEIDAALRNLARVRNEAAAEALEEAAGSNDRQVRSSWLRIQAARYREETSDATTR